VKAGLEDECGEIRNPERAQSDDKACPARLHMLGTEYWGLLTLDF
jgi:hypothetical protein